MMIRCKTCGKNIQYDIAMQKLHCGQCGSSFEPEDFPDESPTFDACTYTCQSCGAELITTDNTEATAFCSFCGSTSILSGRMEKIKKPDAVLPFRITREECREIYLKQARKAFLTPRWLRDEECVNSFRAIYMPYWSYRVGATGYVSRTDTTREREDDYIVETTTQYRSENIDRDIAVWTHDASKAFADDISEMMGFEEVKEEEFRPFHEGYLSGFYADLADRTAETHKEIAEREMQARLEGKDRHLVGNIYLTEHKLNYMPVWFMSARKNNRVTYAAINGYNGKIVADFPVSTRGFLAIAAIAAALLSAVLSMAIVLRPEPAFWCAAVLTLTGLIYCAKEETKFHDIIETAGISLGRKRPIFTGGTIRKSTVIFLLIALGAVLALIFRPGKLPGNVTLGLFLLLSLIPLFLRFSARDREITIPGVVLSPRMLISIVLCILAAFLLRTKNNLAIYGAALFYAFILSVNCICIFHIHQKIASRRPPQFNRKGAAYDA